MSGEFQIIAEIFAPLATNSKGALGLLDDAAVVSPRSGHDLIVTKDLMVSDVHFRAGDPPDLIGKKLLRVNLSDLAAMGATPVGYLLGIALPESPDLEWLRSFASGLEEDQASFGINLLGGDTVATPGPVTLSLTAFGEVPSGQFLTRSGAREGDCVMVSGTIGDGTLGLRVASGGLTDLSESHRAYLADRYRLPRPRVALGQGLRGIVHAATDVSDGLIADLGHICEASGLGAQVQAADIPISLAARAVLEGRNGAELADLVTGGDDYELVFTVTPDNVDRVQAVGRDLGIALAIVGHMAAGQEVTMLDDDGSILDLPNAGFSHF